MGIFVVFVFVFVAVIVSTAVAADSFYASPSSGTLFSLDLNVPGPSMSCIGYLDFGDSGLFQQQTTWSVTENGKTRTTIATSTPTFMLSNDTIQVNRLPARSSLTVLNVTSNLDGAILDCSFPSIGGAIPGVFTLKIYRPPVLKSVGTVTGLKNGSLTFQIGDTSSPPPYPTNTISFTIAGNGSLEPTQIQYNHPNMTLNGLTEANTGAYILTATNTRLVTSTIIGSSNGNLNLIVQFPPVITTGPSLVAAAPGQPATLVCGTNLRSNPPSSILWRNSNGVTLTTGGRYAFGNGSDNVYIIISNTTTSDNGTWSCDLNNGVFAPLMVNIVLFIVVPPSQPMNVTSNIVSDPTTQLYISWQPPYSLGVLPVSFYMVIATSSLDSKNQTANTTNALITKLRPGLSYDITVMGVSAFGGVLAVGPASDKVTFSTDPAAPTLMCGALIATSGGVNVSWSVYNGGRDITAVQIGYTLAGSNQQYQPIQASVMPNATSVMAREQFLATRSYSFQISANNSIGMSNVTCGPVLINEGIPIRPDLPIIVSTKPGTITMTLSVAASGAGATESFAFIINSVPSIDLLPSIYPFPTYTDGKKVSVVINNIKDGVTYVFYISASNAFGTTLPQSTVWLANGTAPPATATPATPGQPSSSVAGPVAGGVIGGIVFVLLILIIIVVIYLVLRQRGGTYEMEKGNKGVKVEEIDVDLGEDIQPAKQEIHYAELGSFKPKEPTQPKLTIAQKAAEEEPVTYSTVQINSAAPKDPTQDASAAASKTDTSTTMV